MDKAQAINDATDARVAHHQAWPNTTTQQVTDLARSRDAAYAAGASENDLITAWSLRVG